jgi:hypothetical protein
MFYSLIPRVLAQDNINIPIPTTAPTDIGKVISGVIQILFIVAALASFLWLVQGGLSWITAGGDTKKTGEAGKQITNALIGLLIVAMAWAIMTLIGKFLHINIFSPTIPNIL